MKAEDVRAKTESELKDQLVALKKRAIQSSLPAGHRSAGEHRPRAPGAS